MLNPSYAAEPQNQQLSQLLRDIAAGHLQIPEFQRPSVWTVAQRLELLRSVAQGFPIGSILVWRTSLSDLPRVPKMGPHKLPDISGPVHSYVLDGLQRLSTLFGALCPRDARTPSEPSDWDIYYRLEDLDFSAGPAPSPVPDDWLPLWLVLDSPALIRFQRRMLQRSPDRESWLNAADSLQKVLLEYKIPVIPFVTDDLDRATLAFARINSHQTPMSVLDMLAALTYRPPGPDGFDLRDQVQRLRDRLRLLGWDSVADDTLLNACKAALGLRIDSFDVMATAMALRQADLKLFPEVGERLAQVIQVLARHQIGASSLLPTASDLVLYSEALRTGCTDADLIRWLLFRLYRPAVTIGDELDEARSLASQRPWEATPLSLEALPTRFDYGSRRGKALALLLLSQGPWHAGMAPLEEAPQLLSQYGVGALSQLVPGGSDGPENWVLCRPEEAAALRGRLLEQTALCPAEMLRSHVISAPAKEALARHDREEFLRIRRNDLAQVERFWLAEQGLVSPSSPVSLQQAPPSPAELVLRLARLRKKQPQLALALTQEALHRQPSAELLSELAQGIVTCRKRPFPKPVPTLSSLNDEVPWELSPDGRRLLLWPEYGSPAVLWDINEGTSIHLEGTDGWTDPTASRVGFFSPDGSQLAMVDVDDPIYPAKGLFVWDTASGAVVAHDESVRGSDIQFSPDGKRLLIYRAGGARTSTDPMDRVVLWSKEEGAKTLCEAVFPRAELSPDDQWVMLSQQKSPKVTLYSIQDQTTVALWPPDIDQDKAWEWEDRGIRRCCFAPDSRRVLTCSDDGTGRIWGIDGKLLTTFMSHSRSISWGDWHPGGTRVATVSEDGRGWIWAESGKALAAFRMTGTGRWICKWNAAGSRLLVHNLYGDRVSILDPEGQLVCTLDNEDHIISAPRWHPDGVTVYGRSQGTIARWSTIETPLAILADQSVMVAATFAPDSQSVLTVQKERTTLWQPTGQRLLDVSTPKSGICSVASFSSNGQRFLTVSQTEGVRVHHRTGDVMAQLSGDDRHLRDVVSARFGQNGTRILTTSGDGDALLWSADGVPIARLGQADSGLMWGLCSADGKRVITMDAAATLRLFSTEALSAPTPSELPDAALLGIEEHLADSEYMGHWPSFSPDSREILLPSGIVLDADGRRWPGENRRQDPEANLWDERPTPTYGKDLHPNLRAVDALYSPDGHRVATAHADAARIWSREGRLERTLAEGLGPVWFVRWSADSARLLTVAEGGMSVQIWDARSGERIVSLPGPGDPILDASFSPDGRHLLIHAGWSMPGWPILTKGYVWIWPADAEGLMNLAATRLDRIPTEDERRLYLD